jgi:hypothetical protein
MMCMGDRSTFTSTGALNGRHDGSSPLFLEDLLSSKGVCVFARAQALPPPPNLFIIVYASPCVHLSFIALRFTS